MSAITFASPKNERASLAPISASVHRRGKNLYLHVRVSRSSVQALNIPANSYAAVGFGADGKVLAVRWGLPKGSGWSFAARPDGSVSCSIKIDNFDIPLTTKFHYSGDWAVLDAATIALHITEKNNQLVA